jgi:hypothetical protein
METYRGLYKIKNPKKYQGDPNNIVYRSLWERQCFRWCDENPTVKLWASEEFFIPYLYEVDQKYHRYFVDLKIEYTDGRTVLVEIKPEKETQIPIKKSVVNKRYLTESLTYIKNMNKWEAANKFAKERGWEFQIWTEKTLQQMGLLSKPQKKLKPLSPIKKPSKI